MRSDKSCRYCERVTVNLELGRPVETMDDIPNTYDASSGRYCWRIHDVMAYALIPRAIQNHVGQVDCYVCIDDEDRAAADHLGLPAAHQERRVLVDANPALLRVREH